MTKKDYERIADVIRRWIDTSRVQSVDAAVLISTMADMLEEDNARFDRYRFLDACVGLQS